VSAATTQAAEVKVASRPTVHPLKGANIAGCKTEIEGLLRRIIKNRDIFRLLTGGKCTDI
jgi:hypothetical protein